MQEDEAALESIILNKGIQQPQVMNIIWSRMGPVPPPPLLYRRTRIWRPEQLFVLWFKFQENPEIVMKLY